MAERGRAAPGRRLALRRILADIPHLLFFWVALPLTVLLLMIPASWFRPEGYVDLGEVDFVADEAGSRPRLPDPRGPFVVYHATDGSGLSFREGGFPAGAETRAPTRRHVYIAAERPNAILRLFRGSAGQLYLRPGEDLRTCLNARRRAHAIGRAAGGGYMAAYAAAGILRWRRKRRQAKSPI